MVKTPPPAPANYEQHPDVAAGRAHVLPSARARARREKWIATTLAATKREGCRDWPYETSSNGYGAHGGRVLGHIILERSGRPRPVGMIQLHSCDRPICAAPWHLRWGTYAENAADAIARDRNARGMRNGLAKLTDADVLEIRALDNWTHRDLAQRYGVHLTTIQRIRAGAIWKHLLSEVVA